VSEARPNPRPVPHPLAGYTLAAQLRRHMDGHDVLTDRAVQVIDAIAEAGGALVERARSGETPPMRGGEVEAWVKAHRDRFDPHGPPGQSAQWQALDDLLDDLRDRSDCGYGWAERLDWSAGHPVPIEGDEGTCPGSRASGADDTCGSSG
jgi:hypothetical protein